MTPLWMTEILYLKHANCVYISTQAPTNKVEPRVVDAAPLELIREITKDIDIH